MRSRSLLCAVCGSLFAFSGCVQAVTENDAPAVEKTPASSANQAAQEPFASPAVVAAGSPASAESIAVNEEVRRPATVDEAAKIIDFTSFPLLPGAKEPGRRVVASLDYEATGDLKAAFEFQRKALLDRGFKELSSPQSYDPSASSEFRRNGFHVFVSVTSLGQPKSIAVHLQNLGNVNPSQLPVPAGAKLQYAFPAVASFVTERTAEETALAVRKLLIDAGWQPYGTAGDSMDFKQNAVNLSARVHAPPALLGKTFIDYSAMQLSADLPAPPDAQSVHYADSNKQLNVEARGTPDEVVAFYKSALAPAGWKPTTDNRITDRFESFLVFRNDAKDMLTLTMRDLPEKNMTRVALEEQSVAEVEEIDRQIKLAAEERKRKEEDERKKPKPKATITLPAEASGVDATASEIEFKLPSGQAKAALAAIIKQFETAGWKVDSRAGENAAGQISLKKDNLSISILYVDPGFIPAEITIAGSGLELERATADKP
jgi:hypothetical protein